MNTQAVTSVLNGRRRFVRFLAAGGFAAVANYASRFLFSLWVPFEVAVSLGFLVGLVSGFVLMRVFVFEATNKPIRRQAAMYVGVNLVALAITLAVSSLFARFLLPALGVSWQVEAIAHAVGVGLPVVTSYFAHRYGTFR